MDIERRDIEKRDFQTVRKGYDPAQVDRHLQWIADLVEQLRHEPAQQPSLAGAAASRVEAIVGAAEASAREIEERARAEAQEVTGRAEREAADHVQRAHDVVEQMLAQARELQAAMGALTGSISDLRGAVDSMRGGVDELRPAQSQPPVLEAVPEPTVALEPEPVPVELSVVPEPEPEAQSEPDPEPEPEPKPAPRAVPTRRRPGGDEQERASEGARLIALNMALSGAPREETARYLQENFDLQDQDELLDEVYARVGS